MRIGNAIAAQGLAALVALAALAPQARANAAWTEGYEIAEPEPGKVTIYVHNFDGRSCPSTGLLRRDTADGEVVKLAACDPSASDTAPFTFVDECVPAGEYQYGLADALACTETSGTERYATWTVPTGAAADCARTLEPGPEPMTASAADAWPSEGRLVCDSSYGELPPGCSTGGAVMGLDAAVLAAGLALWRRRAGRRRA